MDDMTQLTQEMFDRATSIRSVEQAAQVLLETGCFRTLGDVLRSYARCDDPKEALVHGWMSLHPGDNRESVDKKVRNWLAGRTSSIGKQDAFQICLLLGLSLTQADDFLKRACGEGIHWRDPEDIIWGYGILHCKGYGQICEMQRLYCDMPKLAEERTEVFTGDVKAKLDPVLAADDDDALLEWLRREQTSLGRYHNTAYRLFVRYMSLLESAGQTEEQREKARKNSREDPYGQEAFAELLRQTGRSDSEIKAIFAEKKYTGVDEKISSRDILEVYLYRSLVPIAKRGKEKGLFSGIQNSLRANWPDETTISKMKKRQADVTRKVMILLFLATDGGDTLTAQEDDDEFEDAIPQTRDEIFEDIYKRLNLMLRSCGFPMLDPRVPFDWVVLYCICVDDTWDVDQRLADILTAMFPGGNEKQ